MTVPETSLAAAIVWEEPQQVNVCNILFQQTNKASTLGVFVTFLCASAFRTVS